MDFRLPLLLNRSSFVSPEYEILQPRDAAARGKASLAFVRANLAPIVPNIAQPETSSASLA
jgi:hypothetical protein